MAASGRIEGPVTLRAHSAASPHGDADWGAPKRGLADRGWGGGHLGRS